MLKVADMGEEASKMDKKVLMYLRYGESLSVRLYPKLYSSPPCAYSYRVCIHLQYMPCTTAVEVLCASVMVLDH